MTATMTHPADMLQKRIDTVWALTVAFAAALMITIMPDIASAGGTNAIEIALCNVYDLMTSTTGKVIASIAVIVVGIGALMGKISWGMAFIVAIGIALVFGASSIVDAVSGRSGGMQCSKNAIPTGR